MENEVRNVLRDLYPFSKTNINKRNQKKRFKDLLVTTNKDSLKIVIGSCQKFPGGWIPTEKHFLDLLRPEMWSKYFKKNTINNLLAEHVWEHLTPEQGKIAAQTCYEFLKKGGRLRVAVPDGYHTDQNYINYVKPGGIGLGADDHKVLYNHETFSSLFAEAGFEISLLEYFDNKGEFQAKVWDEKDGFIQRSIRHDERNQNGSPNYTSLILDAIKK
ncbi:MAG: hypothetical protein AB8B59_03480 [Maribacter sp.]